MKFYAVRLIRFLSTLAVLAALSFAFTACQDNSNQNRPTDSVVVKVPVVDGNSYKLGLVELSTLQDTIHLRGQAARFLFSPSVRDGQLSGYEPRVRLMRNKDGVYVAQDSLSLELLALYANLEGLMKFDQMLGVKDLNVWPRPVAVNTRILDPKGRTSKDNARYSGQLDAFLFEPFSRKELPLTVNAGVMGHEHFHSIFYQLVLKKLGGNYTQSSGSDVHELQPRLARLQLVPETTSASQQFTAKEVYHLTLTRAMNEGLADAWGWIYSGDTDFVSRSLSFEKSRDLKLSASSIPTATGLSGEIDSFSDPRDTLAYSYFLGSQYAKLIYQVFRAEISRLGKDGKSSEAPLRQQLARSVLRALPRITQSIQSLSADETMSPSRLIEIMSEEIPFLRSETCDLLREKVPETSKSQICARMSPAALAEKNSGLK